MPFRQRANDEHLRVTDVSHATSFRRDTTVPLLVILTATAIAFSSLHLNHFVNWDDPQNLIENDGYKGLGWSQLRWMFTTFHGGHYQPLTWLSFALDYQLWPLSPAGYHLTNLAIHVLAAAVFFLLARQFLSLTCGSLPRRSAVLAATVASLIFCIHPLRVESVAWATERRDVLSGFWFLLTLLSYLTYVRGANEGRRRLYFAVALSCFILSLLSKAWGVVLPFVLLILDGYPLRRLLIRQESSRPLIDRSVLKEKLWFLVPAFVFALLAARAQRSAGAMWSVTDHPVSLRMAQALYGLLFYIGKTVVPTDLSPLYEQDPSDHALRLRYAVAAVGVVAAATSVWKLRRRFPFLLASSGVYVVFLAPVSGIFQSGPQVVADRYSHLACLPWALLLGGGFGWIWQRLRSTRRFVFGAATVAAVASMMTLTYRQVGVWRDSRTLWTAAIERGGSEGIAHANLASVLNESGEFEAACQHSRSALDTLPGNRTAHITLGVCSAALGELATAEEHLSEAIRIGHVVGRQDAYVLQNLASVQARLGRPVEAEKLYRESIAIAANDPMGYYFLAGLLASEGRSQAAIAELRHAVALDPAFAEAHYRLAELLLEGRAYRDATQVLEDGLAHAPDDSDLSAELSWVLATAPVDEVRDGNRALDIAKRVATLTGGSHERGVEALAAALAETGNYAKAIEVIDGRLSSTDKPSSDASRERLVAQREIYASGRPMRK